ncbi:MAG: 4a-hydroxytetrahydrobiopterin dehydratase [Acidobacteria bacterium]|nr:4a-hydroxytetrahydrobiopterin dehydratase [Acidobacteriota bacterium]
MERRLLTAPELKAALKTIPGWSTKRSVLRKRFEFEDFDASYGFVKRIAKIANRADHHPDITFGWGYAEIALSTHDRGGITDADIAMAQRIELI